jgi:hypothetical protein
MKELASLSRNTAAPLLFWRIKKAKVSQIVVFPGGEVGGREDLPVLLGFTQPPQHVLLRPIGSPLWELCKELLYHGSDNVPRRYGVDSNPIRTPFRRQITTQLQNRRLGGVICGANQALVVALH